MFDYFIKIYKLDDNLKNKILNKLEIELDDLIIVNKMKFYTNNLNDIKKKDLSIDYLYNSIVKIILGLHFFHSEGFAHGDLKPLNIVSDNIDYKICDFGGIKYISNPKYDCTCTSTYRSPEDYEFEYCKMISNNTIYEECPLKSDIWSLGLIFNELINKSNPIQIKYNQFRSNELLKKNNIDQENIEYKIHLYLKKMKGYDISSVIISTGSNHKSDDLLKTYKLKNIIQQILCFNPKLRINLYDVYWNLFHKELPNLDENKIIFNYYIKYPEYFDKFISFRKKYYQMIKLNLENTDEVYLYPFISN